MSFAVTWERRANAFGIDDQVAVLEGAGNRLEVWPALGFNAYRWSIAGQELLYCHPEFFSDKRPTRSGFPILFPFPNRIRAGRFTWAGKEYELPIGDPANRNAIHGFVCQRAWRIVDQGADETSAWIAGEFHGSVDAAETMPLWPADYRLRVTYRLRASILRVEAEADNPGTKPLPFGLGYHPYFTITPFGDTQAVVSVMANKIWELVENLPTGKLLDIDEPRDLRHGQSYAYLQLDDAVTDLQPFAIDQDEQLQLVGVVQHPSGARLLTLWTSPDFRDLVLFTPAHRQAICLEPYTCMTDAINLVGQVDAGLRVLQPGERWQGTVEVHVAHEV